jgi:hypothetical protein
MGIAMQVSTLSLFFLSAIRHKSLLLPWWRPRPEAPDIIPGREARCCPAPVAGKGETNKSFSPG